MSAGSTVNTLKRGGKKRKSSAKVSQKVSQKVTVNVSLPPRQPNYRVVRQPVRPSSSFVPNQPVRISPPEFRLMAPPNVLQSSQYAQMAAVLADQGTQAIKAGTMRTCKDIAQPWYQTNNPNDVAPYSGSKRLMPTMDYNAPVNSRLVSGDIPPTLSQYQGGLGPLQESSTSAALKPESVTRNLYSSEKYESSMGMAPMSASSAFSPAPKPLSKPLSYQPGSGKKPEPSGYAAPPGSRINPRIVMEEEKAAEAALARSGVF